MRLRVWIAIGSLASGCSGSTRLRETTPVSVTASAPDEEEEAPEPKPRVEVKEDRIDVKETIYFDFSSSRISAESNELLDEIVQVITDHPEVKKLRIEGHTDSSGGAPNNLRLSKKRAVAVVKYLVDHGIDAERLTGEGYGQTKPIVKNDTEENRAKNRRVVFTIVERSKPSKLKADKPKPSDEDDEEDSK